MRKILIALALGCSVPMTTGCETLRTAPLANTAVDEKALIVALQTFDTVLTAVDRLVEAKVIVPGSPRAVQIADAIAKAKTAYQAASAAQRAGSATSYLAALNDAQRAVAEINLLVKGS